VAGDVSLLLMGVPPVAPWGTGPGQRRHAVVRYPATLLENELSKGMSWP
jgi:hypothetical protein